MITLGSQVKDVVTGLCGVAVAKTDWLFGCTRYGIQPAMDKDGKVPDVHWCDEESTQVIVSRTKYDLVEQPVDHRGNTPTSKPIGGPQADPHRANDPK